MRNFGSILVALDFSDCSQELIDKVIDLAESSTRIVLLHVAGLSDGSGPKGVRDDAKSQLLERSRERLAEYSRSMSPTLQNVIAVVAEGPNAETIVEQARQHEADLIIVGTHGRRGPSRLIGGSVAAEVISLADCPVLVVRTIHKPTCGARSCDRCDTHLTPELRQLIAERDG